MTVPCAVCKTALEVEARACPFCGTKRDEIDIQLGRDWLKARERSRRRRWILGAIAAVAAAAVIHERGRLLDAVSGAKDGFEGQMQDVIRKNDEEGMKYAQRTSIPSPSSWAGQNSAPETRFVLQDAEVPSSLPGPGAAAAAPARDDETPPPEQPAEMPAGQRRVWGRVLDFRTRKPIVEAIIEFKQDEKVWKVPTLRGGWYNLDLPASVDDDFTVTATANGYKTGQARDEARWRRIGAQQRADRAERLTATDLAPLELYVRDSQPYRFDILLVGR